MKKAIASFLSLIIILSSFNFSVNAHFCCDELIDFAIINQADGCSPDLEPKTGIQRKSCCKDLAYEINGEEHFSQKQNNEQQNQEFLDRFYG